jgi:hypothetical protein
LSAIPDEVAFRHCKLKLNINPTIKKYFGPVGCVLLILKICGIVHSLQQDRQISYQDGSSFKKYIPGNKSEEIFPKIFYILV